MSPRFTLLRRLGQGAMGVVWQARDEESGQIVALKLLREAYADDPEYRSRFERELELARRVHSPHVVQVLGYGVREGSPYLALEYVDGPSLRERLAEHGPYAWPEARALLAQLAAGLADAHAAGILHRDVKPSNVLLASDGTAKLTDFGIARGLDLTRVTGTSTLLGTPAYLAPEGPLDARSDLYALGVIAYELLAGAPPFEGPTYQAVILAHIRTPPDLSKLPPEARSIVGWLLAKDPAQRPQSAAELLAALQDQGSVPAIAPPRPAPAPVATTPPSRPPRRRPRALAGLAALALVVLLVGAALAMGGTPSHAGPLGSLAALRTGTSTPAPTVPATLLAILPVASPAVTPALPSATPAPLATPRATPRVTPAPTPRATPQVTPGCASLTCDTGTWISPANGARVTSAVRFEARIAYPNPVGWVRFYWSWHYNPSNPSIDGSCTGTRLLGSTDWACTVNLAAVHAPVGPVYVGFAIGSGSDFIPNVDGIRTLSYQPPSVPTPSPSAPPAP